MTLTPSRKWAEKLKFLFNSESFEKALKGSEEKIQEFILQRNQVVLRVFKSRKWHTNSKI